MEKVSVDIEKVPSNVDRDTAKQIGKNLLQTAGINVNGDNPWDIQVHDENFFLRALTEGPLGLGESYMDKWWDCQRIDIFIDKVLRANLDTKVKIPFHFYAKQLLSKVINFQSKKRSREVAEVHYDLGNDLFHKMLDKRMIYSCGYWKDANNLEDAQEAKLDLICKKLELKPGVRLLDIGCGWGGLARYAAEKYNAHVTGVTISEQQYYYAKENCKGLPIEIRLLDYRDINEQYDRIVSVGMFEHVGHMNYPTFMHTAHRALKNDGLFLLHTIGVNETTTLANEWIIKYIFPNGMLPSIAQITRSVEKLFIVEDMQNFGAYYDNTLMAWHKNFTTHWDSLKEKYGERFYRMWTYYLLACAGSFRARGNQLWQFVLSKHGVPGGYMSPR